VNYSTYNQEIKSLFKIISLAAGIPIRVSTNNINLAREFPLPEKQLLGTWEIMRSGDRSGRMTRLQYQEVPMHFSDPQQVNVHHEPLDRVEARGLGFSEMQSYWSLPFHDFAIVGDVCTIADKHNRQLYDNIHVATSNPVWLYSMKAVDNKMSRLTLNHYFDISARSGGGGNSGWKTNIIPRIKMAPLGGRFANVLAIHDEVSNNLVLVEPESGSVISVNIGGNAGIMQPVKEIVKRISGSSGMQPQPVGFLRMNTDFAQDNKLLFYSPKGNRVQLMDLSGDIPVSYKVELPMKIRSLHPLNDQQYLVVNHFEKGDNPAMSEKLFLLRKESAEEPLPTVLIPVTQTLEGNDAVTSITNLSRQGLGDFSLKMVLKEAVSTPNILLTTPNSYATLAMGFPDLEYSANEIYGWPKAEEAETTSNFTANPSRPPAYGAKQFSDAGMCLLPTT
jgi:hypothetical protein